MFAGAIALAFFVRHALRTHDALIDLRLFKNRTFAVSSLTLTLVIISVFGGMLLLPLYLQAVRGESAMDTGLLLAPQGFGAMIAMPIAGRLTDRTGVGRIVPVGLVLVAISFLGLTQLEADTSYWTFGVLLFVMGLGMGATMMPTFSGAMQTLRRAAIARASTTLNINQQVSPRSAPPCSACCSPTRSPTASRASAGAASAPPPRCRRRSARRSSGRWPRRSASTFWWALALVVIAFVVSTAAAAEGEARAGRRPGRGRRRGARRPCSCPRSRGRNVSRGAREAATSCRAGSANGPATRRRGRGRRDPGYERSASHSQAALPRRTVLRPARRDGRRRRRRRVLGRPAASGVVHVAAKQTPLRVNQTATLAAVAPGRPAQTLSGDFDNRNAGPVHVATVRVSIAAVSKAPRAAAGTCDSSDFTLAHSAVKVGADVPSGRRAGAWSGATIAFNEKPGVDQNSCMGATVRLGYTTSS